MSTPKSYDTTVAKGKVLLEFPDRLGAAMALRRTDLVCEKHPHQPWPHADISEPDGECAGPGMPRPERPDPPAGAEETPR